MIGQLRVMLSDGSWDTLQAADSSTVQELVSAFHANRSLGKGLTPFMTICYIGNGCKTERILSPQELPMKLIRCQRTPESLFIRLVTPDAKHRLVSEFWGVADIKTHRKDIWTTRWIAVKERYLTWSKTSRDRKIRGQIDLSNAVVEAVEDDSRPDFNDEPGREKSIEFLTLKIIKPDRMVEVRFRNTCLLNAWLYVIKERCAANPENSHFDAVIEDIEQYEAQAWTKREKGFRSHTTMSAVLRCPLAYRMFLLYLKRSNSEEGLLFWQAVQKVKSPHLSDKHALEIARSIYSRFISSGSQCKLPISATEHASLRSALDLNHLRSTSFDLLCEKTLSELERENFDGFIKSKYFRSYLVRLPRSSERTRTGPPGSAWDDERFEDG